MLCQAMKPPWKQVRFEFNLYLLYEMNLLPLYMRALINSFIHVCTLHVDHGHLSYKVVISGAACRLYFDLEFKTKLSPGSNGPEMVDIFIKVKTMHAVSVMHPLMCKNENSQGVISLFSCLFST